MRAHPGGGQGSSISLPLLTISREDLRARWLLEYPHSAKAQTSMPPPRFEPRPYGTAVSVANHYTGWATHR
ncbi:hypothetical protein TNCV_3040831 [Trichonephila clavipes]|nr:hypothetical protein TNCV_3040831 [Trichonephila clavipes]